MNKLPIQLQLILEQTSILSKLPDINMFPVGYKYSLCHQTKLDRSLIPSLSNYIHISRTPFPSTKHKTEPILVQNVRFIYFHFQKLPIKKQYEGSGKAGSIRIDYEWTLIGTNETKDYYPIK